MEEGPAINTDLSTETPNIKPALCNNSLSRKKVKIGPRSKTQHLRIPKVKIGPKSKIQHLRDRSRSELGNFFSPDIFQPTGCLAQNIFESNVKCDGLGSRDPTNRLHLLLEAASQLDPGLVESSRCQTEEYGKSSEETEDSSSSTLQVYQIVKKIIFSGMSPCKCVQSEDLNLHNKSVCFDCSSLDDELRFLGKILILLY